MEAVSGGGRYVKERVWGGGCCNIISEKRTMVRVEEDGCVVGDGKIQIPSSSSSGLLRVRRP